MNIFLIFIVNKNIGMALLAHSVFLIMRYMLFSSTKQKPRHLSVVIPHLSICFIYSVEVMVSFEEMLTTTDKTTSL